MNYAAATQAIRSMFATAWGDTTPVAYPNVAFDIPNGVAWARFTLKHFDGRQASVGAPGANKYRRDALVTIQIFTPQKISDNDAIALGDQAVDIFLHAPNDGIKYFDVQLKEIGPDDAGCHQINVLAYVQYDRIA